MPGTYPPVVAEFRANVAQAIEGVAAFRKNVAELQVGLEAAAKASLEFDARMEATAKATTVARDGMVALGAEASGLTDRLGLASREASSLSRSVQGLNKSTTSSSDRLAALSDASTVLGERIGAVDASLTAFSERLAVVNAEASAMAKGLKDASAGMVAMSGAADKASASNTRVAESSAAAGMSVKEMRSALLMVGGAFGITDLAVIKMAGDFQQSTTKLLTSAGEIHSNIDMVRSGLLDMAGQVGVSATHLSDAMYKIESAGYHGAAGLGVLKAAEQGAKAEGAEGAKVADALSSALRDYYPHAQSAADVTKASTDVMSKLIGATSAGKMTFDELAGSLNSILPVSSAAKISLSDTLGVLAAMTVHGISAQQATQNMADAIRHLQAPTMVMSKAMATLGIDSVDVASKLGERGLSGTMQMLSDAVKKAMPPGSDKVILDLGTALSKSTPQVKALGERLLDGSISMAGFSKEVKALDPLSAKQAQSFSTLAGSFHQLGTQQISGAQVMQTYGGMLQKLMGDATGLKVALMATGENAEYTNDAIKTISESTADAKGNVKGWADIEENFNQKMAETTAAVGALAIRMGTNLLPVAGAVAGFFGKLVEVVDRNKGVADALSASFGVLAVALPVVALGMFVAKMSETALAVTGTTVKIGLLAAGLQYGISHWDTWEGKVTTVITGLMALQTGFTLLSGPVSKLIGFFGGAAKAVVGFVESVAAAEGVMATTKVALGGGMGFLAGPWGLALGAAAAAIAVFASSGDGASKVVDDLTSAIEQDSGALGRNSAAWAAKTLDSKGALQQARDLKIAESDVTAAALGQGRAMDDLRQRLQAIIAEHTTHTAAAATTGKGIAFMSSKMDEQAVKARALLDAIGGVNGSVNASKEAYDRQTAATIRNAGALNQQGIAALKAASTGGDLASVQGKVTDALDATNKAANSLTQQLDLLNGRNIDAMSASMRFKDSVDELSRSFTTNGHTIDENTAGGRANLKTILDATQAAQRHADAITKQTGSAEEGRKVFEQDTAALAAMLRQTGVSEEAIRSLTASIWQLPDRTVNVNANVEPAITQIGRVRTVIRSFTAEMGSISVNVDTRTGIPSNARLAVGGPVHRADGGGVRHFDWGGAVSGAGTSNSDSIPSMLSDKEFVVRARQSERLGPEVLEALNSGDFTAARNALDRKPGVAQPARPELPSGGGNRQLLHNELHVHVHAAGSILAEGDLMSKIRTEVLRYTGRNPNSGWTPAFN